MTKTDDPQKNPHESVRITLKADARKQKKPPKGKVIAVNNLRGKITVNDEKIKHYQARNRVRDIDKLIAQRLYRIWQRVKKEKHLTQMTVAQQIGMNQSAVSQYLNGYLPFNVSTVIKFASVLGADPLDIAPEFKDAINTAKRAGSVHLIGEFDKRTRQFKPTFEEPLNGLLLPVSGAVAIKASHGGSPDTIYLLLPNEDAVIPHHVLEILVNDAGQFVRIDGEGYPPGYRGDDFKVKAVYRIIGQVDPSLF